MPEPIVADKEKKVLWIEDEILQLEPYAEELERENYTVLRASTVDEAEEIIEREGQSLYCAVIDIRIPVANGGVIQERVGIKTHAGFQTGSYLGKLLYSKNPKPGIIGYSAKEPDSKVIDWFRSYGHGYWNKLEMQPGQLARLLEHTLKTGRDRRTFIVHGHDHKTKRKVQDYIRNTLKLGEPVILFEEPTLGRTIIEKFEEVASSAKLVFVLLTPDDKLWDPKMSEAKKRRARQNVIFELGYFFALFKRRAGRVLLLYKGDLELPSDLAGLIPIDISRGMKKADAEIRREIEELCII